MAFYHLVQLQEQWETSGTSQATTSPETPRLQDASMKSRVALLTLLVLDLALDVVNRVRALHLQGDGLASQSLDKDLHATAQTQHQMEGGLLLDVVVCQGAAVLELLASKDQALLVRWDSCMMARTPWKCWTRLK